MAARSEGAQPSDAYAYSNSNYNPLPYVIEQVSGLSYERFVEERIFGPLAMASSAHAGSALDRVLPWPARGYIPEGLRSLQRAPYLDWSVKVGNGPIVSTAADLERFHTGIRNDDLLEAPLRQVMFTPLGGAQG